MGYKEHRNTIEEIQERLKKLDARPNSSNGLDDTYWDYKHVGGSEFLGEAIIRFLPAPKIPDSTGQEKDAIVKYKEYTLHRSGKLYIQRGRDSLGQGERDPAVEWNAPIWNDSSLSKEAKIAKIAKKTEKYIANIYVIKDPNKPENEGKVFRMLFGNMIYKKIKEQLFPEFDSSPKVDVFDPENGANFYFRVSPTKINGKGCPTYIKSSFAPPSKMWDVESGEFDKIWSQEYSLQSEIAPDKFKSYDELKSLFDRVVSENIMDVEKLPLEAKPKKEEVVDRLEEIAPKENKYSEDEDLDDWFNDLDSK